MVSPTLNMGIDLDRTQWMDSSDEVGRLEIKLRR